MDYDPPPLNSPPTSWPVITDELGGLPTETSPSVRSGRPNGRPNRQHGALRSSAAAAEDTMPSGGPRTARQIAWTRGVTSPTILQQQHDYTEGEADCRAAVLPSSTAAAQRDTTGGHDRGGQEANSIQRGTPGRKRGTTRVIMKDLQTKDFNYNRVNTKIRRNCQIDDLDKRLREETRTSRRLQSVVTLLQEKLKTAEEGRRRSNGLERAFYSYLVETEALVLQRERLMRSGANETRAESFDASRKEAHERLATVLRRELEANSFWGDTDTVGVDAVRRSTSPSRPRTAATSANGHPIHEDRDGVTSHEQHQRLIGGSPFSNKPTRKDSRKHGGTSKCNSPEAVGGLTQQSDGHPRRYHHHHQHHQNPNPNHRHQTRAKVNEIGSRSCWDLEGVVQAYRSAAAGTVRRLSSALFGEELLAIETAKMVAAEREKMLETKAREIVESQVALKIEKDELESFKDGLRSEVREAKTALKDAKAEQLQQREMVNDAERVRSSLSRRILSMQVARDQLSETVGERLRTIQAAVRRRVGFLPRAVERAVNDLVALCSAAGPSDCSIEKGLLMGGGGSISSGSTASSL